MKPRITLPVICAHFRYDGEYGCHLFKTCDHTAEFKGCSAFQPVRRAGAPEKPKMTINELIEARRRCGQKKAAGLPCDEFKN